LNYTDIDNPNEKLEVEHSIECITDADHSIALIKTVLRLCCWTRCVTTQPQRDGAARLSRRDVMHFVTQ